MVGMILVLFPVAINKEATKIASGNLWVAMAKYNAGSVLLEW
jgi:hypothetical protein